MGILPHALVNSLARLGWSHGDQEEFSIQELVDLFSLTNVGKSAGIFNMDKLLDLNGKYIRAEDDARLADLLLPFLADLGYSGLDKEQVTGAVRTLKPRAKTLVEMAQGALFYFREITYDKDADERFLRPEFLEILEDLLAELKTAPEFSQKGLEGVFLALLEKHQIKLGKIAQPVRVALTGKTVSPGIFEVMEVLGRQNVLKRLAHAISHIKGKKAKG